MEMSVKAGGNSTTIEQPTELTRSDQRNASELDAWLERAEAMGELKRITAEVSPDLETAHITYLVGLTKNPALLF
jgi:3-octaprenyl-4-hydroxybenzoate carboxy-lyase